MKAYQDASLAPARRAKALLEEMTLAEKVGQLNQRLYGFRIYERKCVNGEDTIELSEEFRQEVEKYSGLGVLYGLYRADPWADKDYETGLTGVLSKKTYNPPFCFYVLSKSSHIVKCMKAYEHTP